MTMNVNHLSFQDGDRCDVLSICREREIFRKWRTKECIW